MSADACRLSFSSFAVRNWSSVRCASDRASSARADSAAVSARSVAVEEAARLEDGGLLQMMTNSKAVKTTADSLRDRRDSS